MRTLKYSIGTALTSATFLLAPAVPVAADTVVEDSHNNTTTNTTTVTTTTTETESNDGIKQDGERNIAIQGNCSGVIISHVSQSQSTSQNNSSSNSNSNSNNNGGGGGPWALELNHENGVPSNDESNNTDQSNRNDQSSSNSQNSSSSQSAGITFSPDCSTHNVTNMMQAAAGGQGGGVVAAASTSKASQGGRGAGAQVDAPKGGVGAGVGGAVGSSLGAVLGLSGSLGSLGLGLRRLHSREL